MPIFKYTVANQEGKKLSGTVEAPSEKIARKELNNLGFSILQLTETQEAPTIDSSLNIYIFEAIDKNSKLINGTIPSKNEEEAFTKLHEEYALTVTAIWPQGASEEEINEAKKKGNIRVQEELQKVEQNITKSKEKNLQKEKETAFTKAKIETVLNQVNKLLSEFDQEFEKDQKLEINKKINKLLRIKNSTNLDYILSSAEDLLTFIQKQEVTLKEKGHQDKRIELQMKTREMLDELNKKAKPQSLSEDIIQKIETWESHKEEKKEVYKEGFLAKTLNKTKKLFKSKPEIMVIKQQIKIYNRQLWEFSKLYFKEPTPEYKEKVKNSIKTIYNARKKAKHSLKHAIAILKERKQQKAEEDQIMTTFTNELNAFTGWLLAFYIVYYFIALYITTKNFGLTSIPDGFLVYKSHIFKYALGIIFILHSTTSVKLNFLQKSKIANIALPIIFIFGSIIVLLNF